MYLSADSPRALRGTQFDNFRRGLMALSSFFIHVLCYTLLISNGSKQTG